MATKVVSGQTSSRRWFRPDAKPRVGVSACLLGEPVRFDGGHKKNDFLVNDLGAFVEWVVVCPENELGLGVPRETMRLEMTTSGQVRLVGTKTRTDHTDAMTSFAETRVRELKQLRLAGFVLKKDSPSCGMERVRIYEGASHSARRIGRGIFAEALIKAMPLLPVEEEGRLTDPKLRENFIERVFAYERLTALFQPGWKINELVEFHTAHKFQLLAHSPKITGELGRLVAQAHKLSRNYLERTYSTLFMEAMAKCATPGRHVNVMQHIVGYFRNHLDQYEKEELASLLADYKRGLVPLVVPITLIRHYVNKFKVEYLMGQFYLEPHPKELMLRNRV